MLIPSTGKLPSWFIGGGGPVFNVRDLPLISLVDECPTPLPKLDVFVKAVGIRGALLDTGKAVNVLNLKLFSQE